MDERGNSPTSYPDHSESPYIAPPTPRRTEMMPPPPKAKRTTPLWMTVAVGIGGLIIGVAIGNGGKNSTTTTAGTSIPTANAPAQTTAAAVPAATKAAPAPAPAKAAKTVVLTTSGNGIKQTKSFTTGDDWSVTYTFDCASFGSKGNFAISEDSGDVLANALATKGGDTTYKHSDAGTHSLSVDSECDWTLKVTDGDAG